jgi:hypothetical protein
MSSPARNGPCAGVLCPDRGLLETTGVDDREARIRQASHPGSRTLRGVFRLAVLVVMLVFPISGKISAWGQSAVPPERIILLLTVEGGIGPGVAEYVRDGLNEAAARGAAVLLISEDLEEILALCDTIHVMSRGRLLTTPDARPDRAAIGRLMLGHA